MKKIAPAGLIIGLVIAGLILAFLNSVGSSGQNASSGYVAMGDSFAAGDGLKNGNLDPSGCDQSTQAFPNLVAKKLDLALKSLACGGASINAGIMGRQNVNGKLAPAQLNLLFQRPKPRLITLTVGLNDVGWETPIKQCLTGDCDKPAGNQAYNLSLANFQSKLTAVFKAIQKHYAPLPPLVIVTGYNQIFSTSAAVCPTSNGLDAAKINWLRQLQTDLNASLQRASQSFIFAKYTAVNFNGHEVCTKNSWVQSSNDVGPYHPTAACEAAYARQMVDTYDQYY